MKSVGVPFAWKWRYCVRHALQESHDLQDLYLPKDQSRSGNGPGDPNDPSTVTSKPQVLQWSWIEILGYSGAKCKLKTRVPRDVILGDKILGHTIIDMWSSKTRSQGIGSGRRNPWRCDLTSNDFGGVILTYLVLWPSPSHDWSHLMDHIGEPVIGNHPGGDQEYAITWTAISEPWIA